MKTMPYHRTPGLKVLTAVLLMFVASMMFYASKAAAHGGHGGAWAVGGLLAGHMLTRMSMNRQAAAYGAGEMQGASAVASVPAAPAHPSTMTPEQKISQLNKLAAGGYITPAEYKAKKQAILNSL